MIGSNSNPFHPRQGTRSRVSLAGVCLIMALLLCMTVPTRAVASTASGQLAEASQVAPTALFAFFELSKYFSISDRTNVIRVCVFVMALALFIMLKKFNNHD